MGTVDEATVKYYGDATNYVDALNQIDAANKKMTKGVTATGETITEFGKNLSTATSSAVEGLNKLGANKWFDDLGKHAGVASEEVAKVGKSLKSWWSDSTIMDGFYSLRRSFDSATAAAKVFASDTIPEMFEGAWNAACMAVAKSVGVVKAAVVGFTTFVMANPVLAGAGIAAFAAAAGVATLAVGHWRNRMSELNAEFAQNAEDRKQARKEYEKETEQILRRSRIELTPEAQMRTRFVGLEQGYGEFEQLEERRRELEKMKKAVQSTALFADSSSLNMASSRFGLDGSLFDRFGWTEGSQKLNEALKENQEEIARVQERFNRLTEDMVTDGQKVVDSIMAVRQSIEEQNRTMGMTDTEARFSNLRQDIAGLWQAGGMAEYLDDIELAMQLYEQAAEAQRQLNNARVDQMFLDQAKAAHQGKEFIKDQTAAIEDQLAKLQMTNEEYTKWKTQQDLMKSGKTVSKEDLEKLDELRETLKIQKEISTLKDKGKKLNEQYSSPDEKFKKAAQELNEMLTRGFITQETYNKGVENLGKEYDAAANKADKATAATMRFDASLQGSVESMARIANQRDFLTAIREEGKGRPSADVGYVGKSIDPKFDMKMRAAEEEKLNKSAAAGLQAYQTAADALDQRLMMDQNDILQAILEQLAREGEADPFARAERILGVQIADDTDSDGGDGEDEDF